MTDFRLADALDKAAEALAEAAMILRIGPTGADRMSATESQDALGAPSFEELPFDEAGYADAQEDAQVASVPHGSLAVCPKHGTPYSPGRYGPYCQSPSDDPLWRNAKGFCNLTPKNAAVYLRQKAAR